MRAVAAQLVLIGHSLDFFLTGLPEWLQFYRLQEFGVVVFFALSGYLIAYSSDRQQSRGSGKFSDYLRSRSVRIYSTLIPALLLIAMLDIAFSQQFAEDFPLDNSLLTGIANLLQMQEYPGVSWPFYGSGYPLWSLPVEWWLYMGFGVCVFRDAWRSWYSYPLLLLATGSILYNSFSGNAPGIVFAWMLGAVGYWWGKPGPRSSSSRILLAITLLVITTGWLINARQTVTAAYHPLAMLAATLLVLGGLQLLRSSSPGDFITNFPSRLIRKAANYSFTLYLTHFSILAALYPLYGILTDGWLILLAVGVANLVALLFARCCEWHWNPQRGFYQGGT